MVVDKIYERFSFKRSKWLGKHTNFITQKRNKARNDFDRGFYTLYKNVFNEKTKKNCVKSYKIKII